MGKVNTHQNFLDRIIISPTGCWEWQGTRGRRGYGKIIIEGKHWRTHRYSYQYYKGPVDGFDVLHKCDNTCCCNPDHLFLGDPTTNALDMIMKGRGGRVKLTVDQVFKIRELFNNGIPRNKIIKDLGIKARTVDNVIYGKRWAHLTDGNRHLYKCNPSETDTTAQLYDIFKKR